MVRTFGLGVLACLPLLGFACSGESTAEPTPDATSTEDVEEPREAGADVAADVNKADVVSTVPCASTVPARVVAANLTSGNKQNYDPGHGIRILKGLAPMLVLLQEFNYKSSQPADLNEMTQTICGADCKYVRGNGDIPNGILTTLPIMESGSWLDTEVGNRDFVWARIDLPGPNDLLVVSVHLLTSGGRSVEGANLAKLIETNMKPGEHVLLGGDFNSPNRNDGSVTPFSKLLNTAGPYPTGPGPGGNSDGTNMSRKDPLDWLLASTSLEKLETPTVMGAGRSFARGLVFDTRYYVPLSDAPGTLLDDSAAPSMQHMAVVRTFNLCN
ncbi:MAG: endonuclease/exonuclease/phosphatase family protein [Polyangiaceae bacterium]|nr:endonuclease/exonuclease/phosphatase family protein [Polyangiaceae bacterium]